MTYPVLIIDWERNREMADNIWNAQMACCPQVLTYCGPALGKMNRKEAMHFKLEGMKKEIMHILSRDEYPFACTLEGGGASWVGHVPAAQNSSQGGLIASFIKEWGIEPCASKDAKNAEKAKFRVRVVNHPQGEVVPPPYCRDGKNLKNLAAQHNQG
jgi:deoxyribonuclease NucA/NucB